MVVYVVNRVFYIYVYILHLHFTFKSLIQDIGQGHGKHLLSNELFIPNNSTAFSEPNCFIFNSVSEGNPNERLYNSLLTCILHLTL